MSAEDELAALAAPHPAARSAWRAVLRWALAVLAPLWLIAPLWLAAVNLLSSWDEWTMSCLGAIVAVCAVCGATLLPIEEWRMLFRLPVALTDAVLETGLVAGLLFSMDASGWFW